MLVRSDFLHSFCCLSVEHSFPQKGLGESSEDVLLSNDGSPFYPPFAVPSAADEDQFQVLFHRFLSSELASSLSMHFGDVSQAAVKVFFTGQYEALALLPLFHSRFKFLQFLF